MPEEGLDQPPGVVGAGGGGFPTHVKAAADAEIVLANGAECEPFLTCDHRVMLEQADDIFMGIRYLLKSTGAERCIIGIEANKQDAADHLAAEPHAVVGSGGCLLDHLGRGPEEHQAVLQVEQQEPQQDGRQAIQGPGEKGGGGRVVGPGELAAGVMGSDESSGASVTPRSGEL